MKHCKINLRVFLVFLLLGATFLILFDSMATDFALSVSSRRSNNNPSFTGELGAEQRPMVNNSGVIFPSHWRLNGAGSEEYDIVTTSEESSSSSQESSFKGKDGDNSEGENQVLSPGNKPFFTRNTSRYISVLDMKPPEFLGNFKNPCWREDMPFRSPYADNLYRQGKHGVLMTFEKHWLNDWNEKATRVRCLPYFYVAGFAKCGTTDVYDKIGQHPQVIRDRYKEIHWWWTKRTQPVHGKVWTPLSMYVDLFDGAARKIRKIFAEGTDIYHPMIVGDGSPSTVRLVDNWRYLPENAGTRSPRFFTPHYIHHLTPAARVIILVRNPTNRLYSSYLYFSKYHPSSPEDFHQRVVQSLVKWSKCQIKATGDYDCVLNPELKASMRIHELMLGLFHLYIRPWLEVFPREQLLFLRLEDYAADKERALQQIYEFLGLDPLSDVEMEAIVKRVTLNNHSQRVITRGAMWNKTRELLNKFYKPHNEALAGLLGDQKFAYS